MITMRNSIHGFSLPSYMGMALRSVAFRTAGAPLLRAQSTQLRKNSFTLTFADVFTLPIQHPAGKRGSYVYTTVDFILYLNFPGAPVINMEFASLPRRESRIIFLETLICLVILITSLVGNISVCMSVRRNYRLRSNFDFVPCCCGSYIC